MTAAAVPSVPTPAGGIAALRLARLLIRYRLRYLWNGVRARGRGRFPTLVVVVGLFMSLAYVGLFAESFRVICENTDLPGQVTALAVVALTIAFGSFTAKAASSEAVLAGSSENEFLLARPVALPTLVVARCFAEAATDPLGALFLLPVLLAATITWHLPGWAVGLAALVSMLVQLGISGLAQATQIALVRFVPRRRRRAAWMTLGLLASLSLASLWMMGTRVLRAPATLATGMAPWQPLVARSPGALIVGPLAALKRGSAASALLALVLLAGATALAVLLASTVARRAGMRGWEEAGASWADATARPNRRPGRVLTAATKDLALIMRDRTRLLTLISMPVIFVGVQLFGTAGWSWSTANLSRVSHLAFSLTLYMVTIGPLAHMQAERKAFWIMRAVPVSVSRLLAAKAKAWSVVIGGVALTAFAVLSLGMPSIDPLAWLGAALVVVGGAVGVTWLAIALAASAADLSDEQRPAIGPATIYTFMLVGGLYNVILAGDAGTRVRGFLLYAFAIAAQWQAGVRQATICLDAEAVREQRITLSDGAALVIALALGQRGATAVVDLLGESDASLLVSVSVSVLVGLATALYLWRRPNARPRSSPARAALVAAAVGAVAGGLSRLHSAPQGFTLETLLQQPLPGLVVLPVVLAEELLYRGVIQRGVEEALEPHLPTARARALAALVSVSLAVVASGGGGSGLGILLVSHGAAALTRAVTGRNSASVLTRLCAMAAALAFDHLGR
jgi:hypothetical protein